MAGDRNELSEVYRGYAEQNRATGRWSTDNPGNRMILEDRQQTLLGLLSPAGLLRTEVEALDLGCGSSTIIPSQLRTKSRIGVDLLFDRLHLATTAGADGVACADGAALPFPGGSFDVVVLSTVLSSVSDRSIRARIGSEVTRVLRPGGAVIWYDMRVPNPANRNITAIGRKELRRIFPRLDLELRSTTLVPQVARRLGERPALYRTLGALQLTRSHWAGVFTKQARSSAT